MTLVDETGNEKFVSVEDDWLVENGLDVGSISGQQEYERVKYELGKD